MVASFSIVPIGVGEELKEHVAEVLKLIDESGLPYKLGAMQTTVEGDLESVMSLFAKCHRRMRKLAPRVLSHLTIDDRKDARDRLTGKVTDVEAVLGKDLSHE